MMVIYYDNKWFACTCIPITNDWRDDVSNFKFTGNNWQVLIVPNTLDADK